MAYVLIRSEEWENAQREVLRSFGGDASGAEAREYAECVAARTQEVLRALEGRDK